MGILSFPKSSNQKRPVRRQNSCNGVFLPATTASQNVAGAAVHSTLHTNAYYQAVNQMLLGATNRAEAEAALKAIGQALLSGGL